MFDIQKTLLTMEMVSIIMPYFSYAWAFKLPNSFRRYFTQKGLIKFAQTMKLIETILVAPFLYSSGLNPSGVVIGLLLIFVGQYLNEIVYSIIGDAGVYYGLELMVVKPRKLGGFPFTMHDPMYKGAMMTIIGAMFCFNSSKEIMLVTATWMLSYFSIVLVENTTPAIDQ